MLRSFALPPVTPTKFHCIETPSYFDSDTNKDMLFPFTYSNGTIDIQYIDSFEDDMVTTTGQAPSTDVDSVSVQLFGGQHLVQRLGDNFKSYIRAWRDSTIDAGSAINIYGSSVVQKVSYTDDLEIENVSYTVSTRPPTGDNFIVGAPVNNYRSTWIFRTPLTFTTVEGGVTQYISFTSVLDQD